MNTYPKIDTIFMRDTEGAKKLIENNFRDPTIEYLKDNVWEFTEKIDGTNIRLVKDMGLVSRRAGRIGKM